MNRVFSFQFAVLFCFLCQIFRFEKYETYETFLRMLKPVSRNTKFRETRSIFSRNTKLVSHEILENFVRKKLECQPYYCSSTYCQEIVFAWARTNHRMYEYRKCFITKNTDVNHSHFQNFRAKHYWTIGTRIFSENLFRLLTAACLSFWEFV